MQPPTWRASVPLVCFDIVEHHLPGRVLRQYGMVQDIPAACNTSTELHASNKNGRGCRDWTIWNQDWIQLWASRADHVVDGDFIAQVGGVAVTPRYMPWFLRITRRWMFPRQAQIPGHYAPAAPVLTDFAQDMAAMYRASQEPPVRQIAIDRFCGSQFSHFIHPEPDQPHTGHDDAGHGDDGLGDPGHGDDGHADAAAEEAGTSSTYFDDQDPFIMSLSHPDDASGSSQDATFLSPPFRHHITASEYRQKPSRPTGLDIVEEDKEEDD